MTLASLSCHATQPGILAAILLHRDDDDIKRFESMGGEVVRSDDLPGRPVIRAWVGPEYKGDVSRSIELLPPSLEHLMFQHSRISDDDIRDMPLSKLPALEQLELDFSRITGTHLERLAAIRGLKGLSLAGTRVGDGDVAEVNHCKSLKLLHLDFCSISDRGVSKLILPALEGITLSCTRVGDQVFPALAKCPKLQFISLSLTSISDATLELLGERAPIVGLDLDQTPISDLGLARLARLPGLKQLRIMDTKVTDKGMVHLQQCKNLELLNLAGDHISDKGVASLQGLKSLSNLDLSGTDVTDAVIEILRPMKGLRELNLSGCKISKHAIESVKKARPDLSVEEDLIPPRFEHIPDSK